jgi:hypothetical protein
MSSILRISGQSLDIDALLSENSLPFDRIWRKGEPRVLKGKLYSDSGANFLASGADLDEFDRQVSEATEYLEQHAPVIAKMVEFPGVQNAVLDFGFSLYEGSVAQFSFLPPKLVRLAASAGIGLEISHYACSKDDEDS